jgi:hypothetical protein
MGRKKRVTNAAGKCNGYMKDRYVDKCAVVKIIGWCLVFNLALLKFLGAVAKTYRYTDRSLRE